MVIQTGQVSTSVDQLQHYYLWIDNQERRYELNQVLFGKPINSHAQQRTTVS